jgi:hypothetical protein
MGGNKMGKKQIFFNPLPFLSILLLLFLTFSALTAGCATTTYTSEGIAKLSVKEIIAYRFVFNEKRVYQ